MKLFTCARILLGILFTSSLLCSFPSNADSMQKPDAITKGERSTAPEPGQVSAHPESGKVSAPPPHSKLNQVPSGSDALSHPPWRAKLNRIAAGRDVLSARLAEVHGKLRALVRAEKPELLARLEKEAPKTAATGYGFLPLIVADEPDITDTAPIERRFSIAELGDWVAREHGLVAELASRLEYRLSPLERDVEFYNKRAENFRNLDAHVGYHSFWQEQAPKWPLFWTWKKELLASYRTWRAQAKNDEDGGRSSEARQKIQKEMLRITASPALCIERDPSGGQILPVRVATDVTDEAFLAAFAEGVERFWNGSQAMKDAHLRFVLTWDRKSPESLYPKGAPRKGERIDTAKHARQFGSAPSVLTTGGDSTHARLGLIVLGTARITRRALAHEFSHLLGLDDAYIRAYDGSPEDQDGVVFFEVTPFPESLLASPGRGRVTTGMVETLLDVYGRKACLHETEKLVLDPREPD